MTERSEQASANDFLILGLEPDASLDNVKAAYISLVKTWHPDRYWENPARKREAEEKLKTINAAYRRIRQGLNDRQRKSHFGGTSGGSTKSAAAGKAPDAEVKSGKRRKSVFADGRISNRYGKSKSFFKGSGQDLIRCLLALSAVFLIVSLALHPSVSHWYERINFLSPAKERSPVLSNEELGSRTASEEVPDASPVSNQKKSTPVPEIVEEPSRTRTQIVEDGKLFFTLGSSEQELLRIQGKPSKVQGSTWIYGLSSVTFRNGKIYRYNNFDGTLKVRVLPSSEVAADNRPTYFSLGSSKNEVLSVQGTPTRTENSKWYYGFSEIDFKENRVVGFNNFFNYLKIIMLPQKHSGLSGANGRFTIGSDQDEVLAVQGTPTGIQGNLWSYQLSTILFQEGRVRSVSDPSGNLLFLPPDMAFGRK